MDDYNTPQPNGCQKNQNKHRICSNCNIAVAKDYYRRSRTVCKLCYNSHVLA